MEIYFNLNFLHPDQLVLNLNWDNLSSVEKILVYLCRYGEWYLLQFGHNTNLVVFGHNAKLVVFG